MTNVRVWFKKTGLLRFISHLDINRLFGVALKKSKLPLWYTEGFNPHIYITFNTPLSLGVESLCESFEMRLTQDIKFEEIIDRLNAQLPEGIEVYKAAYPIHKAKDIASAQYMVSFEGNYKDKLENFLSQKEILVEKTTKKKTKTVDLKLMIEAYTVEKIDGNTVLRCHVVAGTQQNLNPMLLAEAFCKEIGENIPNIRYLRENICVAGQVDFT